MARIKQIAIKNFKGIEITNVEIQSIKSPGRFVTLIGLNESGKTTILEAISHSVLSDFDTKNLMKSVQGAEEINDIIPRDKKAAFTGTVEISTYIELDDVDLIAIESLINERGFVLDQPLERSLRVSKEYEFQDSSLQSTWNRWNFTPQVRRTRGKKVLEFNSHELSDDWQFVVKKLRELLPYIVYFPTFLVNFPNRIYLEGDHGDVDKYYRQIINDALGGVQPSLSIEHHVLARAKKHKNNGRLSLSSALRSSPEGQQIDAVVQRLSAELNRVIFGAWNDIFGKRIEGRRISVEWHVDEQAARDLYLEIYIVDGLSRYYIQDRSLGFRWFFSFLMFTQFQANRVSRAQTVFLFDEPASHLHAKAQTRLLESFERIASPSHVIVYSTHSHYMINPLWLDSAYVVINSEFNMDDDDPADELSGKHTQIGAKKYKAFVSANPSKTTYFQPALDALEYATSPLTISGPAVVLEGKYDYYPFMYLRGKSPHLRSALIYPALGAGSMSYLISMFRAQGQKFCIILDDDKAGRKEKARYRNEFLLKDTEVMTLGDLVPSLAGAEFEGLFQEDIRSTLGSSAARTAPKKDDFYTFFQNALATDASLSMPDTQACFDLLASKIEILLESA